MPNVLPTIPNDPPQGIQALLDKVYLWNPDVSNDLIEKINALLTKLGDAIGAIRPYNELVAPINQYEPCYYGDGVYVAKNYLAERAEEFNEEDWILIARKEITADKIHINFAGQDETVQNAIDTLKTDQGELGDQVSAIESKIPADASETNQLVTKNEVLALPTFTYTVVQELPETGEEKIIYLVPKAGEGHDVHDEYIWVNGGYELIGTTAVDLSGYLPTTGGTMTGLLTLTAEKTDYSFQSGELLKIITESKENGKKELKISATGYGITLSGIDLGGISNLRPASDNSGNCGESFARWRSVCTTKLNNGADLNVPTEGGTLARLEDLEGIGGGASLPDQTGNAGKFLTTDGVSASWGEALVNKKTEDNNLAILGDISSGIYSVVVGPGANVTTSWNTVVGANAKAVGSAGSNVIVGYGAFSNGFQSVVIGESAQNPNSGAERAIAIGWSANANQDFAIQLGTGTNSDANTFKVANNNGNFEMMDADGNVPLERLTYVTDQIAESVTTKDLTVGTDEGTLNIGITAGVATIATNNGLDIVAQTKFDTAPTTDDSTAWADVNATALVTKAQVTTALSTAGGGTSVTIRNWA